MLDKDTIAIISSPQGQGAISIIRVIGDEAHICFRKDYSDLKSNEKNIQI